MPNCGQCLDLREMLGSSRETHLAESGANGTGRDDDDFVAILAEGDGGLDYKS